MTSLDKALDRRGVGAEKWDVSQGLMPFTVAELDFAAPPCVLDAMKYRLQHPNFGYSRAVDGLTSALCGWLERRRGWEVEPKHIVWSPGTVLTLISAIEALTMPGDAILVPTPIYPPFLHIVESTGRRLVASEMQVMDGRYTLDFEHLEAEAALGATMLLFCSPHNPTGRVWTEEEMQHLADIAVRHDMVVVSDEVHADVVYDNNKQQPFATCVPNALRLVTAYASSKTFCLTGLGLSAAICSHAADRQALAATMRRRHLNPYHPITMEAFRAGWSEADTWVDELVTYLDGNRRFLHEQLTSVPGIQPILPASTFLMWVDCRGLRKGDLGIDTWFQERGCAVVNTGTQYGLGGNGYVRINFGTQRAQLRDMTSRLLSSSSCFL